MRADSGRKREATSVPHSVRGGHSHRTTLLERLLQAGDSSSRTPGPLVYSPIAKSTLCHAARGWKPVSPPSPPPLLTMPVCLLYQIQAILRPASAAQRSCTKPIPPSCNLLCSLLLTYPACLSDYSPLSYAPARSTSEEGRHPSRGRYVGTALRKTSIR